MLSPKVFINIVAWQSMHFLPDLLASIFQQTFHDFQVLVIDNGSDDGVESFLRALYPTVIILRNARNLGFAPAHNQGIRYALEHWRPEELSNCFILVTNPDTIWEMDFLEKLLSAALRHPSSGAFGGKLLRAYGENLQDEVLKETVHSDRFDSTGLSAHRSRSFTDRGAGELDSGQYNQEEEVFGISGALALYRASSLQDIRFSDEFFDPLFFSYKEDVDLAWRLRQAGWGALYVPTAQAYHYRGMYMPEQAGWLTRFRHRRGQSPERRYYSTRNHLYLLVKNEHFFNFVLAWPWLLAKESGHFLYILFFETRYLKAYAMAFWHLPKILKKRWARRVGTAVTAKDLRKWFK